jgi:hypothetical protein
MLIFNLVINVIAMSDHETHPQAWTSEYHQDSLVCGDSPRGPDGHPHAIRKFQVLSHMQKNDMLRLWAAF